MAKEQTIGNKIFQCPACGERVRVSVLVGMQQYTCPKADILVSLRAQQQSFLHFGLEVVEGGKEKLLYHNDRSIS